MNEYPAWRFRAADHHTVVVLSKEEDESLEEGWLKAPPEGFVCPNVPTYRGVEFVVNPIDVDKIEAVIKERQKPGPKPKAK